MNHLIRAPDVSHRAVQAFNRSRAFDRRAELTARILEVSLPSWHTPPFLQ
jgi:hypothetical protein